MFAAARAARRGGVVLYPTEGVWGLGCDPQATGAIEQLLRLKHRPADKGLILLAADSAALAPWAVEQAIPPQPEEPRATTWIVPARRRCPSLLRGKHRHLAVRITRHPPTAALCRAAGGVLVSTSANRSGLQPPRNRWAALRQWGPRVDGFSLAPLGGQHRPSRIFDTVSGAWIRL